MSHFNVLSGYTCNVVFPSPYGEEVSVTSNLHGCIPGNSKVSVPLRGRGKCNFKRKNCQALLKAFPSPYGEEVSATSEMIDRMEGHRGFPSPYGEEVSATLYGNLQQPVFGGFRPLTGKR